MSKPLHSFGTNLNINLDSIESELKINESLDCKSGIVSYNICLKSTGNDNTVLDIKLVGNYQLNHNQNEVKYLRNDRLLKHIINGKVVINETNEEELISVIKVDDYYNIKSLFIIAVDFTDINERLAIKNRQLNTKQLNYKNDDIITKIKTTSDDKVTEMQTNKDIKSLPMNDEKDIVNNEINKYDTDLTDNVTTNNDNNNNNKESNDLIMNELM
ncbi:probable serine/threonine-protein kinase DDB_G0283337 [Oppia nitens]|uniref:probable serine/threonine-protein kinase DDB_G0283337 n=1 Tax=Oppia nitens TaxID=1686743 RepID=UPI0023DAEB91|nr:probable serine/threonine-protein kinase DDB_G0283337 [Oppia nitens]